MSSQRGNCVKSGPRKHQNTTAYRNDLHRKKDKTMKILNSLQITGCCKRCKEVIEWKIKYNKYKPLTRPKKCVKCLQKSVTNSYFIICQNCIESQNLCGKCASVPPVELSAENSAAPGSEINTKPGIVSSKRKSEEEDEDSDSEEGDIDLDNELQKVLTINNKPNQAEKKDGTKRKASDRHKVTFESSDSESDNGEELVTSVGEDKDKLDKDKCRLNEDKDKLKEDNDKLNEDEDELNEDEADGNKLSTDVKKGDGDQSELDESDGEDDEDDGDDEEDEDDN